MNAVTRIRNYELEIMDKRISLNRFLLHPLFSGSVLMIGGSLGNNGINYVYHLLMGRLLGPVDYGNLATIFSILYFVGIVPTSTSFAIVKFISSAKTKKERDEIYLATKLAIKKFAIVASGVVLVFAWPLKNFLHLGDVYSLLFVGPIVYFMLLTLVNKATLQGVLKFFGVVASDFVSSLGKLIIGLILVYLGYEVAGATFAIILSAWFAYIVSEKMVSREVGTKIKANYDITSLIKFAFPVLIQALAFTSIFTVDLIIIKHFFGEGSPTAGYYAALSMLGKIIFFATQPVSAVMFPIVAGKRSKGENYRMTFYLSAVVAFVMSLVVLSFYYLLPDLAVGVLYGEEYLSISPDLVWMGIFMTFYTISNLLVNFLLSLHRTKVVFFPLTLSILQAVILWFYHTSIREVLYVNVSITGILIMGLVAYLGYNEVRRKYAKAQ